MIVIVKVPKELVENCGLLDFPLEMEMVRNGVTDGVLHGVAEPLTLLEVDWVREGLEDALGDRSLDRENNGVLLLVFTAVFVLASNNDVVGDIEYAGERDFVCAVEIVPDEVVVPRAFDTVKKMGVCVAFVRDGVPEGLREEDTVTDMLSV